MNMISEFWHLFHLYSIDRNLNFLLERMLKGKTSNLRIFFVQLCDVKNETKLKITLPIKYSHGEWEHVSTCVSV